MYKVNNKISYRLDFLRGMAAQFVLIEHILTTAGKEGVFIGSFGVVIFFVLSGFLIHITTMNAYEQGRFSLRYYLSKRFFRIFTLYVPLVLLCFFIDNIVQSYDLPQMEKVVENSTIQNLLGSLLMLQQNVFSEVGSQLLGMKELALKPYGSARPFWTVAIEWWIYIAYGFFFAFVVAKKPLPKVISWLGILLVFSLVVVFFNIVSGIGHNLTLIWLLGALLGHFICNNDFAVIRQKRKLLYIGLGLLFISFIARLIHMKLSPMYPILNPYDMVNVIVFSGFFFILLILPTSFIEKGWLSRFVRFMGEISYALYLIHFTILSVMYGLGWFDAFGVSNFLIAFFLSNIIAILLYYSIDRHHAWLWRKYWMARGDKE